MSISKVYDACCGCSACINICPKNIISTYRSEDGFLYPNVDSEKCVECGKCESVCPVLKGNEGLYPQKAYYGRTKDETVLKKSSSGGIFSEMAKKFLDDNGIVFGAVFDDINKEVVITDSNHASMEQLRRSKYVESNPKKSFIDVKNYLENGKNVLYVGLPCQIAGLKNFLGKDYDSLLTVDFICGGSASTVNFREHLIHLEKKYNSRVINVNFRPKLYGWKMHSFKVEFENGMSYLNYAYLDTYFRGFVYEKALIRECCNSCQFSNGHESDIILADFWGYRQLEECKDMDDKGMSLIMINTAKGEEMIDLLWENMNLKEISLENISYNFRNVEHRDNKKKKIFMENYRKFGFEKAARKTYMKHCIRFKIRNMKKSFAKR